MLMAAPTCARHAAECIVSVNDGNDDTRNATHLIVDGIELGEHDAVDAARRLRLAEIRQRSATRTLHSTPQYDHAKHVNVLVEFAELVDTVVADKRFTNEQHLHDACDDARIITCAASVVA